MAMSLCNEQIGFIRDVFSIINQQSTETFPGSVMTHLQHVCNLSCWHGLKPADANVVGWGWLKLEFYNLCIAISNEYLSLPLFCWDLFHYIEETFR